MQRVTLGKGVLFSLLCLFTLSSFLGGCINGLGIEGLYKAEDSVISGEPVKEHQIENTLLSSPAIEARKKIVTAMNSILSGNRPISDIKKTLLGVKEDLNIPRNLRVEAGYVLLLLNVIEKQDLDISQGDKKLKECVSNVDKIKKERDDLIYKLKKMEEIYIHTEKRRGMK